MNRASFLPQVNRVHARQTCKACRCRHSSAADVALLDETAADSPEITRRTPSAEVARRVLAACVARLVRALARILVDEDPEWIHQARCATRALRADLDVFAPLLDREEAALLDARLRALCDILGSVRDNDVLIEHIAVLAERLPDVSEGGLESLVAHCRVLRECAYAALTAELRNDAYPQLLEDLVRSVCRDSPLIAHPKALRRKTLAHDIIDKPWRRLKRAVRACGDDPTPAQLHTVRIKAKRCRYTTEAAIPLVRKSQTGAALRFLRRLTRLQDTLGSFHDAVSEGDRLRELASAKLDRFVAGEVAGLETQIAARARASWRRAWKRVARPDTLFWRCA